MLSLDLQNYFHIVSSKEFSLNSFLSRLNFSKLLKYHFLSWKQLLLHFLAFHFNPHSPLSSDIIRNYSSILESLSISETQQKSLSQNLVKSLFFVFSIPIWCGNTTKWIDWFFHRGSLKPQQNLQGQSATYLLFLISSNVLSSWGLF